MKTIDVTADCQVPCLKAIAAGRAEMPPQSLGHRVKLLIRRRLSPKAERKFKARTNDLMNWICRVTGKSERPVHVAGYRLQVTGSVSATSDPQPATSNLQPVHLQAGDWVRVRPREEIDAMLNHWRQLRGCTFMPEMDAYCGTVQRVLKPLERFVDERDLTVKTAKGIVLLDGVVCQGTADFGRCDRSCVLFWREEWLEKIDQP